jgi:hypothetical protein
VVIGHGPGCGFLEIGLVAPLLFTKMNGMLLEITEELIAHQTPEAQAIIRALLATIQQLHGQLNQSPGNSSVAVQAHFARQPMLSLLPES